MSISRTEKMFYAKTETSYILRPERGDELHSALIAFAEKKKITTAFYYGLGGVTDVVLGYFDLKKKDYLKESFEEDYELINITGNLTIVENKPFPHSHVTLGDSEFRTFSGHLFQATVSITSEIILMPFPLQIHRKTDPDLLFKGMDLPHRS